MLSLEAKRWRMPRRSAALRNALAVNCVPRSVIRYLAGPKAVTARLSKRAMSQAVGLEVKIWSASGTREKASAAGELG